jgi:glutamyl-tRNA reductase
MSIVVIGVSHRTGPLALLERLTIARDELAKAVVGLAQRDTIREAAVLTTCGRTEVYAVVERFHGAYADVTEFLCDAGSLTPDDLHPYLFSEHDDAAARHLFEVAAGLDSVVLGESEILGQVRRAGEVARANGATRTTLDVLFRHAVRVGRRARTETPIGRGTASISHAAVEMTVEHLGSLSGLDVLVVGAGDMGAGVTTALHAAGVGAITIANRSPERGARLAAKVGGRVVGFDALGTCLDACDVAVMCATTDEPFVRPDLVRARPAERPALVVDIAVPRNVDRNVGDVGGVTLLDVDDLRSWADRALVARAGAADAVRAIVDDELDRFLLEVTSRQAAPLVAQLHERAEQLRRAEVGRFARRLDGLDDEQRATVDALTRAIVAKLLHSPSVRLRQDAGSPQGERNAAAVSELFGLRRRRCGWPPGRARRRPPRRRRSPTPSPRRPADPPSWSSSRPPATATPPPRCTRSVDRACS